MAEEKKPNKAGEFLARHGEKAVLAVACAALLAYLVYGVLMKKPDGNAARVKKETDRILAEMEKEHPDMKAPDAVPVVPAAIGPWNEVVTDQKPAGDWTGSFTSKLVGNAKDKAPPPVKQMPVIPAISLADKPEVSIDGVTLKWVVAKPQKFTPKDNKVAKAITHFSVERAPAGTDKWEVLDGKLKPTETGYRDGKTTPKSKYLYRVTSWCDDKEYTDYHKSPKGMEAATPEPVATMGIWRIRPITMMKGQAYIEIEKFEQPFGMVKVSHNHFAGDRIGWWKNNPDDPKATSLHLVPVGPRSVKIDFNSGMKLTSVEPKKFTKTLKKCVPKFSKEGQKIGCDEVTEEASIDLTEMAYVDDNGEAQVIRSPDPDKDQRLVDKLCPEHGGKAPEAPAPKEEPKEEKKEAPKTDEKKEAPKAEKKEVSKAEAEAEKLLLEASQMEEKKPAGALERYEKLRKDYAETQVVKKSLKVIADKITALKKK